MERTIYYILILVLIISSIYGYILLGSSLQNYFSYKSNVACLYELDKIIINQSQQVKLYEKSLGEYHYKNFDDFINFFGKSSKEIDSISSKCNSNDPIANDLKDHYLSFKYSDTDLKNYFEKLASIYLSVRLDIKSKVTKI